jgi:hypothetical protein
MVSTLAETRRLGVEDWRPAEATANGARRADGAWERIIDLVVGFRDLGDDWDGQGASAFTDELLESAIGLAYTLEERGVGAPSRVVPGTGGTVLFEWQFPDGTYSEIEVVRPFHAEVMLIEPGKAAEHWTLPSDE